MNNGQKYFSKHNTIPGFVHILVLILVVIGIGALGYFSWKNGLIKYAPTGSTPSTSLPTSSETNDWKTYTNQKLKYTFKYPPNWKIGEGTSQGHPYITFSPPNNQVAMEIIKGALGQIYVDERAPWFTDKKIEESVPLTYPGSADSYDIYTINGISGVKYSRFDKAGTELVDSDQMIKGFGFFKQIDGETLIFDVGIAIIDYNNMADGETEYLIKTFDQILSTFQFIEDNEIVECLKDPYESLSTYLTYLYSNEYNRAAALYGDSYPFELTNVMPETLSAEEKTNLLSNFLRDRCVGFASCLKYKITSSKPVTEKETLFGVQFYEEDGTLFKLYNVDGTYSSGPFDYSVIQIDGCYKNIGLPLMGS